jgi:predicted nucleic acid-binding protein
MIVVDASVAFKWFDQSEESSDKALKILATHRASSFIIVPDLLIYELTNGWSTKSALSVENVVINLQDLEEADLKYKPIDFKLAKKAAEFSKKYQVSSYDATYAVLAEEKGYDLITADDKFANKVKLSFVKKLSEYE